MFIQIIKHFKNVKIRSQLKLLGNMDIGCGWVAVAQCGGLGSG